MRCRSCIYFFLVALFWRLNFVFGTIVPFNTTILLVWCTVSFRSIFPVRSVTSSLFYSLLSTSSLNSLAKLRKPRRIARLGPSLAQRRSTHDRLPHPRWAFLRGRVCCVHRPTICRRRRLFGGRATRGLRAVPSPGAGAARGVAYFTAPCLC